MAKKIISPRERYGGEVKENIFGDEYGTRAPSWIAEKTGISVNTLRTWRRDPGKMPAYRYLQIMQAISRGQ